MKSLNMKLVAVVRSALKGNKLAKFDGSIAVLQESLAQGAWTLRGSVKANSGFYQGIVQTHWHRTGYGSNAHGKVQDEAWQLDHCLSFGGGIGGKIDVDRAIKTIRDGTDEHGDDVDVKLSDDQIKAWVALCAEKNAAFKLLNEARPKPVLTKILLSPKVTKTLTECNLDLDLPSICMAKLVAKTRPAWKLVNVKKPDGSIEHKFVKVLDSKGKQAMETYYVVEWSKGIAHNRSRFAFASSGMGCHACGKNIPSGRFVPIEAKDKKSGKLVSMWIGCDCARNIFGIKDIGVEKNPKVK